MQTYTFLDTKKRIRMTVKKEFLDVLASKVTEGTVETIPLAVLAKDYNLFEWAHNPNGPAFEYLEDGRVEYFLDGKSCTEEQKERIIQSSNFDNTVDELSKIEE
jgi:hypothetical protein